MLDVVLSKPNPVSALTVCILGAGERQESAEVVGFQIVLSAVKHVHGC